MRRPWVSRYTGFTFRVFTKLGRRNIAKHIRGAETRVGKLRTAWHVFWDGELCYRCGRRYDAFLWWCESNDRYDAITGRGAGGCFCPACFDAKARALGLMLFWTPRLQSETRFEPEFQRRTERPMSREKLDTPEMRAKIAKAKARASAGEGGSGKTPDDLMNLARANGGEGRS